MAGGRSSKRSAAQERLRSGFLAQVGAALHGIAEMLDEDGEDARDAIHSELARIASTAGAVGAGELEAAASQAAVQAESGVDLLELLLPVARCVRAVRPRPRFAAIGVLGDQALVDDFERARPTTAEPLITATDLARLARPLAPDPWAALLVPVESVTAAREIAEGALVIAWGEGKDWPARLASVDVGADGFISREGAIRTFLDRVRADADRPTAPPEVFVIVEPSRQREAWIDALFDAGFSAVASTSPNEIAPALDVVCPDVLVIGGTVSGVPATSLVRAARGHGQRAHVPALVVGDDLDEEALRRVGADDLLPGDVDPQVLVARLRQRYERGLALRRGRHPVSDALDRQACLRMLDDRLGHVVRTGQPLTVAIVQVEGIDDARDRWGKAAANAAQREVVELLTNELRRLDLIGQVSEDAFLVALHDCPERIGRRRIAAITGKLEAKLHGDRRLKELLVLFGAADTELGGPERVVQRADADLLAVRQAG